MLKKLIFKIVVLCTVCATLIAFDGSRQEAPAGQSVTWCHEIAQELAFNRTRQEEPGSVRHKAPAKPKQERPTHRRTGAISPRSRNSVYKQTGIGDPQRPGQASPTAPDNATI